MKIIIIQDNGKVKDRVVALVDDIDAGPIWRGGVYSWCAAGKYPVRARQGFEPSGPQTIYMSREIAIMAGMAKHTDNFTIKYKDGNPLNCQRANLMVFIKPPKAVYLNGYDSPKSAAAAYNAAAKAKFGKSAILVGDF